MPTELAIGWLAMRAKIEKPAAKAATARIILAKTFFGDLIDLSRFAVEVFEQPAEACFALDVGQCEQRRGIFVAFVNRIG